ncbi:cysteine hydrolase [Micromonospora sp. MSM11]|nr:isochorismatase family protein [Micromonospora sp. MSM11]MCL7457756.1 cysteine hydrolase [Micromonospora sp. MSM11]
MVERWQHGGGDVVFTRYFNYPGPFECLIHWAKYQTAPETDIVTELQPYAEQATAIVDKRIYSLFDDRGAEVVAKRGWTDLCVCGIATESCVLKTVVDAFERNLTPWLIEGASISHAGQKAHDAGLLVAERFVGRGPIITTTSLDSLMAVSSPG